MLETLFDTIFKEGNLAHEFRSISSSQLKARALAQKTVAELEKKGQVGLTIEEVELFLRALAALRTQVPTN